MNTLTSEELRDPAMAKQDGARLRQFCTFRIDQRLYGVDIHDVKEVNAHFGCTPIFHAPRTVKGYMNIRGHIYLLLDLRRIVGLEAKAADEADRIILFKPEVGENFGILVDKIAEIETVDEAQIENRRKKDQDIQAGTDRRGNDIALGICKMEKELLVILNSRKLLDIVVTK